MRKKYIYTIIPFFLLLSCQQVLEKAAEKIVDEKKELVGKYHTIKTENIKIFLPEEFKYISQNEYLKFIEKSRDIATFNSEKERLDLDRKTNTKMYFFEYFASNTIINIYPVKHIPFDNENAKYMLAVVDASIKEDSLSGVKYDKIEAQFKGNKNLSIFKVIHGLKNSESRVFYYKYTYFISYNKKSVFVYINTPVLFDFDPYIEKIRL